MLFFSLQTLVIINLICNRAFFFADYRPGKNPLTLDTKTDISRNTKFSFNEETLTITNSGSRG